VGVAPKKVEDMTHGYEKTSLTYAHCKSGRGRGPFTPIVVQALRFLFESQGEKMENALADFERHNEQVKKLASSYSEKLMGCALAIPTALAGLVVAAKRACERGRFGQWYRSLSGTDKRDSMVTDSASTRTNSSQSVLMQSLKHNGVPVPEGDSKVADLV